MSKFFVLVCKFTKRHKKVLIVLILLLCVVMVCAISSRFVAISLFGSPGGGQEVGAIATDRWQMNRVNRIVVTNRRTDDVYIIEDRALIRAFVRETRVARHADFQNLRSHYLRLYAGDALVRDMYWGHNAIEVDVSTSGHLFFWSDPIILRSARNGGSQVVPSRRLEERFFQYQRDYNNRALAALKERAAHRNPIANAITVSYPQQELLSSLRFMDSPNNISLRSLDAIFPVEVMRALVTAPSYVVYRLEEGGYAFLFFHEEHYRLDYVFVIKEPLTRECFEGIERGSSFADVEAIDPGFRVLNSITDYTSLGRWSREQTSTHMVREGFIRIHYGPVREDTGRDINTEELRVTSIRFIPNGTHLRFFEQDFPQ